MAGFLLVFAIVELLWRSQGHLPSVTDSTEYWSLLRHRVSASPKTLLLVGASRMQSDVDPGVVQEQYPDWEVVNLAIAGKESGVAVLKDIAVDSEFSGVLLCSAPTMLLKKDAWGNQAGHVRHSRTSSTLAGRIDESIRSLIAERFASTRQEVSLQVVIRGLWDHAHLPPVAARSMHANRFRPLEFSKVGDLARLRRTLLSTRKRQARGKDGQSWSRRSIKKLQSYVEMIRGRGGNVVFVELPTSGPRVPIDRQMWPRSNTWDRLVELTRAETLRCCDVDSLGRFECPDMSHLDQSDTPAFTHALLHELAARSIMPRATHADK